MDNIEGIFLIHQHHCKHFVIFITINTTTTPIPDYAPMQNELDLSFTLCCRIVLEAGFLMHKRYFFSNLGSILMYAVIVSEPISVVAALLYWKLGCVIETCIGPDHHLHQELPVHCFWNLFCMSTSASRTESSPSSPGDSRNGSLDLIRRQKRSSAGERPVAGCGVV